MSNIYGLLSVASSALNVQQKAIDITGNNIANVNTPGYSRQRLNMIQNSPVRVWGATMSTGVKADPRVTRFYDQFLNAQLNTENGSLGRWEAQKDALEKAEMLFNDVSGFGLSTAMADYWNAWQNVSNNPSGHVERAGLLSAGEHLAATLKQIREGLSDLQQAIDGQVDDIASRINEMADQIAQLNQKITQVEINGHNANDYRDQRDQLVFDLAKLIDIDSFEDGDGNISVMVGGGKPLVEGAFSWELTTADNGGFQDIFWQGNSANSVNITSRITGGELNGWIEARDGHIADYVNRLDSLAASMISEINTLHSSGFTLDSLTTTGVDFFAGSSAADIAVNPAVAADTNLIAAAGDAASVPGDNSTALAIAGLQNKPTLSGGTATFDQYFSSLLGNVGSDVQEADFSFKHQDSMVLSLENRRQEVSGVSLDEEMVNLVKFQHAYNAAAKLITTTDEMLETLLSIK
jgi:flagellar hook-associated protein 1 FlgK